MPEFFYLNFWAGWAVWTALYISDYSLTLNCARLYQSGVREKIVFEGSYELTRYCQRDIDGLRRFSPRFFRALLLTSILLFVVWRLASQSVPELYSFLLGALILVQLSVHKRHISNLFQFLAAGTDAIRGRIEFTRVFTLRYSALDLLLFSGLYFVLFVFVHSWFLLGGSIACLSTAYKHWNLAREQALATSKATAEAAAN